MSASTPTLHSAALRISVLHILRAAGFHSTRPSVLDALVDITERYLLLLASSTASHALFNHNSLTPTVSDVRCALTDAGILLPPSGTSAGGTEDAWTERLRPSPADYDAMPFGAARRNLEALRDADADTADVRAFADWVLGDKHREIRRVAGQLGDDGARVAGPGGAQTAGGGSQEDFLTALKRRNKGIAEEEKWVGTVLGRKAKIDPLLIEGGEVGSVLEWGRKLSEMNGRTIKGEGNGAGDVQMEGVPG